MADWLKILSYSAGFGLVAVASDRISKIFQWLKLPLITGLILIGMIAGPYILGLIPKKAVGELSFINDFSLAFIAFAAGSELYLKELRSRMRSIAWMTVAQLVITFALGAAAVYFLASIIPFMNGMSETAKIAVALLAGTIFVARSPSSAIAIINEMRAKGPFTSTAIGVTVVKDVLVIILFAICFSLADNLINGSGFDGLVLVFLVAEITASMVLGWLLGKWLELILRFAQFRHLKTVLILLSGFGVYLFSAWIKEVSLGAIGHEFYLEPLLICIVGSFIVTNFSNFRAEFMDILHKTGPMVYVAFFTLTGASMSLDILVDVWEIALVLFGVRIGAMFLAGLLGGWAGGDPWKFNLIAWMPYITQAGVALGLATLISAKYPDWGPQFATIVIAVIVLNQIVGPPFFKWAISYLDEDHSKAELLEQDGVRDALIFGLENQSLALANSLKSHGWEVRVVTFLKEIPPHLNPENIEIIQLDKLSPATMKKLDTMRAEAIVACLTDEQNFEVVELAYEHLGTRDLIVRLNDPVNAQKFRDLGVRVVEPATAIVSLLDHFVRSPEATSLLLGMDEGKDTVELEILNSDLHGLTLRDLRLPSDVIVLGVKRAGHMLISHGYTRLRKGDHVTLVGSQECLDEVALKFASGRKSSSPKPF